MKTGTTQFCLGGWLLFCPNIYLRSLLQTTDENFWGNAHILFSKDLMIPVESTGEQAQTPSFTEMELHCYFQGLKLYRVSVLLQIWVQKWRMSQMKSLTWRLAECLYRAPFSQVITEQGLGRPRVRTSSVKQYLLDTAGLTVAVTIYTRSE